MQTPAPRAPRAAQRAECWHLAFLSQLGEDGLGEISVVLGLDSQLSVVRSYSTFGVRGTAAQQSPGMVSSSYFSSHSRFLRVYH